MSLEIHIIVALSLTLLILLFVMWKGRRARRKNEERLIQKTLGALQAEISRLENLVKALEQANQRAALQDDKIPVAFKNPPPDLSADNPYWRALSFWIRAEKQWTCENCRINLEDRRSDLHVHHIWGRGFNSPQHLKVLCIVCHSEELGQAFMKAYPEYEAFLKWRDGVK